MNQGKRYIRNTVIVLSGLTVLIVMAGRVYASVADSSTPQWLRSVMTLGLAVDVNPVPKPLVEISQARSLAELRDFTRLSVEGDFIVEVVSAPQYMVSLAPAAGQPWKISAETQPDGLLLLKGGTGSEGAVLRIEAPVLRIIEAQGLRRLTVRGWSAKEMTLRMKNLADVRLEESAIERWLLNAETPVVLNADKATTSAGLNIQASGHITIHGADGKELVDLRGTGGHVSIRNNK